MNDTKIRKSWIDALRAIAMIFVVFGHNAQWCDIFFLYTTPIKIPLFFIISGYLFNERQGRVFSFFKNLLQKLVLPYLCLALLPAFILSFYYGGDYLINAIKTTVNGETYWFMPCLIISQIIWFFVLKTSHNKIVVTILSLIILFCGLYTSRFSAFNFMCISNSLICQFFLLLGYWVRYIENKLGEKNLMYFISAFIVYILLCTVSRYLFDYKSFDIHLNRYYNIPFCMILIIIGCFSLILIVRKITKIPNILIFIGQNTLLLYMWAGITLAPLYLVFIRVLHVPITNNIIFSVIFTLWSITICSLLSIVINKYLPKMVGK